MSNENHNDRKLSLYPNIDYKEIANSHLFVYFAQVVMNAYLEGVSYLGFWDGPSGDLLILVSPEGTKRGDEKVYSFKSSPDETQDPEELSRDFQESVRLIMLDQADDHEVPYERFPEL
jgi:hypothetical protein